MSTTSIPNITDYLNDIYDAKRRDAVEQLKYSYSQNAQRIAADNAAVDAQYKRDASQLQGEQAIQNLNLNEYAAAKGLGSGAAAQIRVSSDNAYLGRGRALADNAAAARLQLTQQSDKALADYAAGTQKALTENEAARAKSLLDADKLMLDWYKATKKK
ncbi:MAG: hypothetical protein LBQ91_00480 [Oscillospiraceae bacterium]|jgi:hypothetical protein|nr:hypothetical protein [Oscillospiraceae bacterium]